MDVSGNNYDMSQTRGRFRHGQTQGRRHRDGQTQEDTGTVLLS